MATSTLKQGFTSTEQLTMTYNENNYVNETGFNRLKAFRKNGVLWLMGNLGTASTFSASEEVTIGTISGWRSINTTYMNVCGQSDATKSVMLSVTNTGAVKLYGTVGTTAQWYRTSLMALSI